MSVFSINSLAQYVYINIKKTKELTYLEQYYFGQKKFIKTTTITIEHDTVTFYFWSSDN